MGRKPKYKSVHEGKSLMSLILELQGTIVAADLLVKKIRKRIS